MSQTIDIMHALTKLIINFHWDPMLVNSKNQEQWQDFFRDNIIMCLIHRQRENEHRNKRKSIDNRKPKFLSRFIFTLFRDSWEIVFCVRNKKLWQSSLQVWLQRWVISEWGEKFRCSSGKEMKRILKRLWHWRPAVYPSCDSIWRPGSSSTGGKRLEHHRWFRQGKYRWRGGFWDGKWRWLRIFRCKDLCKRSWCRRGGRRTRHRLGIRRGRMTWARFRCSQVGRYRLDAHAVCDRIRVCKWRWFRKGWVGTSLQAQICGSWWTDLQ